MDYVKFIYLKLVRIILSCLHSFSLRRFLPPTYIFFYALCLFGLGVIRAALLLLSAKNRKDHHKSDRAGNEPRDRI